MFVMPLEVSVTLTQINGTMRICYVPSKYGKSWFSFIDEPAIVIDIDTEITNSKIRVSEFPKAKDILLQMI